MITVIDLKIGNINSVSRALRHLKVEHGVSNEDSFIEKSDKLILPGVGNFSEAMKRMKEMGLDSVIKNLVSERGIPILGICLGMQLFASYGEEGSRVEGLDLVKGKVIFHRASRMGLRIPHIGWNDVNSGKIKIFKSVEQSSCFYFTHSYEFIPDDQEHIELGYTHYGLDFVSALQKGHIFGTQFHVEKSQKVGLKVLSNFCEGSFYAEK
ncbi:MAG: imidazole glycerol phosphate synthase subunit HisH [Candidatus Eremiobacteraeota bacterium]|nr:imidazole glycerol phosphate synthase subunit HisH [Candidatus Eremiobacteraeota bacterium]